MHTIEQIEDLRQRQQEFFKSHKSKDLKFRRESLIRLKESIKKHDQNIKDALKKELNKSSFEAYATETGIVLHELRTMILNLKRWAGPKRARTPVFALPSRSMIIPEPYGRIFIISPWNYPFHLPMVPLIGAIASGNVAIVRQSRFSPDVNKVMREILSECFPEEHVALIECDHETTEAALDLRWDFIFFTGSTGVGRKIYEKAARNLTPVVLELGGKSPVVVEEDAVIDIAARKIIWGKTINAGQTCIAPDYLFAHKKIKEKLIERLKAEITGMFGENPVENPDYPKLISSKAFERLSACLDGAKIIAGGRTDSEKRSLEPTIIEATTGDKCMEEEIFGPVLPLIEYSDLDEVIAYINSKEKPLAAYLFTRNHKNQKKFIRETSSGACLINDVILHIANKKLPFGGVGESGTGRYHGKFSFMTFSNLKSVMKSSASLDIPLKYPPFNNHEKILRMFLR
jgi:aldehyde dehydrogenase (NAD+)